MKRQHTKEEFITFLDMLFLILDEETNKINKINTEEDDTTTDNNDREV